ncbi:MAG: hypothetical protein IJM59_06310 [Proteobacteria bacterium]|nr:hypothetical protein [Pseudomonadota bacterium]
MKLFRGIAFSLIALMAFSSGALAQDADNAGGSNEPSKYNGVTFTITPPKNWQIVAGSLSEKEIQKLPENLREHYSNRNNSDIIFMDIGSPDADVKGFKDSLNIVTINEPIPLTPELVKELSNVLKQQYESMFEKFELESAEIAKLNNMDVLSVKGHYSVLNYNIRMEQVLVPSNTESLVLTCTYDTSKSKAEEVIAACRSAVESLVLHSD